MRHHTRCRVPAIALVAVVVLVALAAPAAAAPGDITTIAGTGTQGAGGDGGPAVAAALNEPTGVAVDPAGRVVVADSFNHRIRRIATDGTITTIAGTGTPGFAGDGGPATAALLDVPVAVAVDGAGNVLFSDGDRRIRRIDAATGVITTVAGTSSAGFSGDGGPATAAELNAPTDIAIAADGDLLIADVNNAQIRRVDSATGTIDSVTGLLPHPQGGPPVPINLNAFSVDVDSTGSIIYVDPTLELVRRVDATTNEVSDVAGATVNGTFPGDGGPALNADLIGVLYVRVDDADNLFLAQPGVSRVRFVDAATGVITTVVGTGVAGYSGDGGPASSAQIEFPWGLALTADGDLVITDRPQHVIRFVDEASPVPAVAGGRWALLTVVVAGAAVGGVALDRRRRTHAGVGAA